MINGIIKQHNISLQKTNETLNLSFVHPELRHNLEIHIGYTTRHLADLQAIKAKIIELIDSYEGDEPIINLINDLYDLLGD